MEEEKKSIFRKQAIDRVSSPEELDGYLKVTRPGVWFLLSAIIILIVGVLVWAVLGTLETKIDVPVVSQEGSVLCLIPESSAADALKNGEVEIAEKSYKISDAGFTSQYVGMDFNQDILNSGLLKIGDSFIPVRVDASLPEGLYAGKVLIEAIHPISFIIN